MRETRILMGMPVTVDISDKMAKAADIDKIFSYFKHIDEIFSTYKEESEISKINRGELKEKYWSDEMKEVFILSIETKNLSDGYFDIKTPDGSYDPSGLVKGWAILNAAKIIEGLGYGNFYVDAGGDIQVGGRNAKGEIWLIGIKDPFSPKENKIVKTVFLNGKGIATSGTYIRGQHIYNPKDRNKTVSDVVSLSVIGPNVYEADRFATAAFAMGKRGIEFIEELPGFEAYMISDKRIATMTSGFDKYTKLDYEVDK